MTESEKHILQNAKRQFYQRELAHLKTRQGRFESQFLHLDHPFFAGGRDLEASDGGAGAATIRDCERPTPGWLRLWKRERAKLSKSRRRVLDALAADWRTFSAARIAHVSPATVKREKTFFKTHFAQCLQAWKRDFGL